MFTTVRIYTGIPSAGPEAAAKKASLEQAMRGVPGFAGYRLISTADGVATVTICETKEGCEASAKVAAEWVKANLSHLPVKPPQVITGESLVSFGGKPK